jgi:metal-sulfur cluster biosynthetic enzyme
MISESDALETLRQVIDEEVGINIVDLGLVYKLDIAEGGISVFMTMTSQSCPMGEHIATQAERALKKRYADLQQVKVELVWSPPWDPSMMSETAKKQMGTN